MNNEEIMMKIKINQSNIKLAMLSTLLIGSAGFSVNSYAGTDSASISVSATVLASCSIDAGAMSFGNYSQADSANKRTTSSIVSTCTSGASPVISMNQGGQAGEGSTEAVPVRRMIGTDNSYLNYNLYVADDYANVWGNTADTDVTVDATGSAVLTTVYGDIPKEQAATAVAFSDSVAVTITF